VGPSIIDRITAVRRGTSASASGTPAQAQTARVSSGATSSCSTTRPARSQTGTRARHSSSKSWPSCRTADGVMIDMNMALRSWWAVPSRPCTPPTPVRVRCIRFGAAPARTNRSGS
jgi:hypothetical protein